METQKSKQRAYSIVKMPNFDSNFIILSDGQSRGIWCLLNFDIYSIHLISHNRQFMHLRVEDKGGVQWFLTAVYGSPSRVGRDGLWDELLNLWEDMEGPWVLLGDFSTIL